MSCKIILMRQTIQMRLRLIASLCFAGISKASLRLRIWGANPGWYTTASSKQQGDRMPVQKGLLMQVIYTLLPRTKLVLRPSTSSLLAALGAAL